jgi:hypothetical protein
MVIVVNYLSVFAYRVKSWVRKNLVPGDGGEGGGGGGGGGRILGIPI